MDETLRTDFGLKDGLADTTTWGEMHKRREGLMIPEGVRADEPFVQILDPATGTGTFLVEVIDRIFGTMRAKWKREGKGEREMLDLWNDYVPRHLLPRLHGFELMMAPYAIAHMKIGLKLTETKYRFLSSERARIYLTNTLEEPKDFSSYFEQMAPALAHEAHAANAIKRRAPITVVVGNPPYSNFGRLNKGPLIIKLLEDYKRGLREKKLNITDDFIKFLRFTQHLIQTTGVGILGMITNNVFIDGLTHRRMRESLVETFPYGLILDLHGSVKKRDAAADGSKDENVFDIQQGVSISILSRHPGAGKSFRHVSLLGTRTSKYATLSESSVAGLRCTPIIPSAPQFLFAPRQLDQTSEYAGWLGLQDIFRVGAGGIETMNDTLTVAFDKAGMEEVIRDLRTQSPGRFKKAYGVEDSAGWSFEKARADVLSQKRPAELIREINYRPFDTRWTFYSGEQGFLSRPRYELFRHLTRPSNMGLCALRQSRRGGEPAFFVTRGLAGKDIVSSLDRGTVFPLLLDNSTDEHGSLFSQNLSPNFTGLFTRRLARALNLATDSATGLPKNLTPEDVFHFAYAIFHSPTYRATYAEFLKVDFPRIPLTSDAELFRKLCALGADLVALHLLEDDYEASSWNTSRPNGKSPLRTPITRFAGKGGAEVAKGHPKYIDGNVYINPSRYFEGVPPEVWNFHVGGYQVCEKWLKDRRERTLSDEDITHYQRVVVALRETIRLMGEIDRTIEDHGGWQLVGSQEASPQPAAPGGLPFA